MFNNARQSPLVRRVHHRANPLPPCDHQHQCIGCQTEYPAHRFAHQRKPVIQRGDQDHRHNQHGERDQSAAQHEQSSTASRERLQELQNGGIGMGVHDVEMLDKGMMGFKACRHACGAAIPWSTVSRQGQTTSGFPTAVSRFPGLYLRSWAPTMDRVDRHPPHENIARRW